MLNKVRSLGEIEKKKEELIDSYNWYYEKVAEYVGIDVNDIYESLLEDDLEDDKEYIDDDT